MKKENAILVTGSSGLLGAPIVKKLLRDGYKIIGLDPIELNKFVKVINRFHPDLIIGSRLNYSEYTRSHNILNKFGNKLITLLFNLLYNTTFTDIYSCYACFKKNLLDESKLKTKGFEQHAEILCKVVKKGKKFFEVPISYNGRTHEEGKKIKFHHIFSVLFRIFFEKF